ncbi:NAD(P)-dependent oxidoreductase [Neobacillus terrae]|uniref:NAD(P)-dependent oxidoreductase n=1 Tax=Neobacillus terrae TaxID=3034837 RepID=UPI00140BA927|nr:NAD(P)-dependent oxidoreductase [Neobacillus terrae]NHM31403.1 NAD(P)-dependent oxidoreductase [Neobacillus terrae]
MIQTVGFIGLGKMGMPMAKNLLNSGFGVFGTDVNETAVSEFVSIGGKTGNMLEWLNKVDSIILMLPSSKIVNQVIDEVIEHYTPEHQSNENPLIIIDMSSSYPAETRKNLLKLGGSNIQFMDAPVSGGVKKAISGTLTIMAGGSADLFSKCKRLLEAMGSNIFHVGPIGSGHLIKAINNYLSATHLLASCEAVQLLQSFEVDPATAINVFNQSTGRSGSTEYKFPSFILTESYDSGFNLELLRKDLEMATRLFSDSEAATKLPQFIFEKFDEASRSLAQNADHTEIYQYVTSYLFQRGISNEKDSKAISNCNDTSVSI